MKNVRADAYLSHRNPPFSYQLIFVINVLRVFIIAIVKHVIKLMFEVCVLTFGLNTYISR